eukprot:PhF_6_TR13887/c0_g1_i1/m.22305/K05542/DUS1; tRNA-dihydrouridine synthase 1
MDPVLKEKLLSWKPTNCPYCTTKSSQVPKPKPYATKYDFYKAMGSPKFVCAPMVDQSELAFRMMCRKYGTTLCYTPMFHSVNFATSETYRRKEYTTCPEDRPLFVQFCANDPDVLLSAAKHVEATCDAVDINLGCPQGIARKGHYGSFLMEDWELIHTLIHTLAVELTVPVTAKMRIFPDLEVTLAYAKMLADAGAWVIACHGRTRDMKGGQTGLADWKVIRAVRDSLPDVPILANGNVLRYSDVIACLEETKCDGVLSAEGLLFDPRLFSNPAGVQLLNARFMKTQPLDADLYSAVHCVSTEYFECAKRYGVLTPHAKAHTFKLMYHLLTHFPDLRTKLGECPGSEAIELKALENVVFEILHEVKVKMDSKREREEEE